MTFRLGGLLFGLVRLLALPALSACETAPGTKLPAGQKLKVVSE